MMVKIELDDLDANLQAADQIMESREAEKPRRWYLGMSGAGYCPRKNFYAFHGVQSKPHTVQTLRNFASGHRAEPLMIERLRQVPNLDIRAIDADTGRQIEVADFNGHFLGHLDFEVHGLIQAPKSWHVGECKEVGEKKLAEFRRIKAKLGEKDTLKCWNEAYYVQHQLYMHYRRRKRGWLVVASAGVRDWDAVRTDYNKADATFYIERARQIIEEPDRIPDRISEDPGFYMCQWCEFNGVCHHNEIPIRNCRTCAYGKPAADKSWYCQKHERDLSIRKQIAGCDDQRFLPSLITGRVVDVQENPDVITYHLSDQYAPQDREWVDKGPPK